MKPQRALRNALCSQKGFPLKGITDYLVENEVIVELKAGEAMNRMYEAQLLTYLMQ